MVKYAGGKKKPENNLHMPKIEKPLKKKLFDRNNFFRFIRPKWLATRLASGGEAQNLKKTSKNTLGTKIAKYIV